MELQHLDVVSRCMGQTLNPQERSNLEIGLLKRQVTEPSLISIRYWGRIHGETQDYLIAVGVVTTHDYPLKKFYFCTNSSPELQQFPELSAAKKEAAAKFNQTRFKGDPTLLLGGENEPQNPDGEYETAFVELDRLAYVVDQIDRVISVVPIEAYVVSPLRHVIANPLFHGLAWEQAMQLFNYYHFRTPETIEKRQRLQTTDGLIRPNDFLDSLMQDLEGSWSLTCDNSNRFVTLRNYTYPGAFAFHQPETNVYGSVYHGDGCMNPDLAFML